VFHRCLHRDHYRCSPGVWDRSPPLFVASLLPTSEPDSIHDHAGRHLLWGAVRGSTTSILLNIPGEASTMVTCLDGYQMARKGRAGAALGISAIGSFYRGNLRLIMMVFCPPFSRIRSQVRSSGKRFSHRPRACDGDLFIERLHEQIIDDGSRRIVAGLHWHGSHHGNDPVLSGMTELTEGWGSFRWPWGYSDYQKFF